MLDHGQDVHGNEGEQEASAPLGEVVHDALESLADRRKGGQAD
jgi:hypothetical protein